MPADKVSLGDRVWWQWEHYLQGVRYAGWSMGLVETKRGNVCVVRDRYGFERVVAVGLLFKPKSET